MKNINEIAQELHENFKAGQELVEELQKEQHNLSNQAHVLSLIGAIGMQIEERFVRPQIYYNIAPGCWRAQLQTMSQGQWRFWRVIEGEWDTHEKALEAAIANMHAHRKEQGETV